MNREEWNERYQAVPRLWKVDPGPFLGQELASVPPGRALDLGAGEGRTTLWLAQRGWQVTAVDFSDVAVARGRERAAEAGVSGSVTWVCTDLVDFEPEWSGFDLVLLLFVHVAAADRAALLGRAIQALAPGGTILVVGYDTANAVEGDEGVRDPAILFSAGDIVRELNGLRVDRAEQLRVANAVDAVVRAVREE